MRAVCEYSNLGLAVVTPQLSNLERCDVTQVAKQGCRRRGVCNRPKSIMCARHRGIQGCFVVRVRSRQPESRLSAPEYNFGGTVAVRVYGTWYMIYTAAIHMCRQPRSQHFFGKIGLRAHGKVAAQLLKTRSRGNKRAVGAECIGLSYHEYHATAELSPSCRTDPCNLPAPGVPW